MFKSLTGMASMMGNLQHLPAKLEELNQQMKQTKVAGESQCGQVSVVMNGLGELHSVEISPTLVADGDPNPAHSPICQATNQAGAKAKKMYGEAMQAMAKDMNLNLPGMDGLLSKMTGGGG